MEQAHPILLNILKLVTSTCLAWTFIGQFMLPIYMSEAEKGVKDKDLPFPLFLKGIFICTGPIGFSIVSGLILVGSCVYFPYKGIKWIINYFKSNNLSAKGDIENEIIK